jgi:hypothetical protein
MRVVFGKWNATDIDAILMNHKVRLGSKYAFLFNKEIIGNAKSNLFMRPPKRLSAIELDTKLEDEENTSTGSGESGNMVITGDQVKTIIAIGVEEQSARTKQLMDDLFSFEEYLDFTGLASLESIREVRKITRFLIANSLTKKAEFKLITTESISLAAILLATERFDLDLAKVMTFVSRNLKSKGINKLQKIRETKAYSMLGALLESYNQMPESP